MWGTTRIQWRDISETNVSLQCFLLMVWILSNKLREMWISQSTNELLTAFWFGLQHFMPPEYERVHITGWFLVHCAGQDEYTELPVPKAANVLPFWKLLHGYTGHWMVRLYAVSILTSFFYFHAPYTVFIDLNIFPSRKLLISLCFYRASCYISAFIIAFLSNTFKT